MGGQSASASLRSIFRSPTPKRSIAAIQTASATTVNHLIPEMTPVKAKPTAITAARIFRFNGCSIRELVARKLLSPHV